jgi:hypothetical protein
VCFKLRKAQFGVESGSYSVETNVGLHKDKVEVSVKFLLTIGDGKAKIFAVSCALVCSAIERLQGLQIRESLL